MGAGGTPARCRTESCGTEWKTQEGEQKVSSGHFLRGETLVRGFPILRYGQVSSIVRFVLMPDGHHISCPNGGKKYGKETPFIGGLRSPPSAHLRRARSPLNALKSGSRLRQRLGWRGAVFFQFISAEPIPKLFILHQRERLPYSFFIKKKISPPLSAREERKSSEVCALFEVRGLFDGRSPP